MRLELLMLMGCMVSTAVLASPANDSPDARAALASFQAFLDGLGHRNKAAMLAHTLPDARATLMRDGKPLQMTLEALAERVSAPGDDSHEERITDPLVRVDGDVAIVWTRFEFLVNRKLDHCGRDVATLVRVGGQWKIASIEDNAIKACGGSP